MATVSISNAAECDRGQRRQTIVAAVLADVFHGRYRAGQHLVTQELAERFGVSHTPIREALIALSGVGIIDLLPNRGAIVRAVGAKDVREVYHVRRALECTAVRLACGRIPLGDLHALSDELKRLSRVPTRGAERFIARARDVDSRLHDLIASCSGNTFLANEIGRLKTLFRAFRDVAWEHHGACNDYHRLAEEAAEHSKIIEGLLSGNRRAASRAMAAHLRTGMKYWSRSLPANGPTRPATVRRKPPGRRAPSVAASRRSAARSKRS